MYAMLLREGSFTIPPPKGGDGLTFFEKKVTAIREKRFRLKFFLPKGGLLDGAFKVGKVFGEARWNFEIEF